MEQRVHDLVVEQLVDRIESAVTIGLDDDLWELGMTSLESVGLMVAVEDAFDVELPNEAMNRASFRSVRRISAAVAAALASATAGPCAGNPP